MFIFRVNVFKEFIDQICIIWSWLNIRIKIEFFADLFFLLDTEGQLNIQEQNVVLSDSKRTGHQMEVQLAGFLAVSVLL